MALSSPHPLRQPKAATSESRDISPTPPKHGAGLPTKAAAFTQNRRDAPPSRAKAENSNSFAALEYNYWEQPTDSAIREGLEISSIQFY